MSARDGDSLSAMAGVTVELATNVSRKILMRSLSVTTQWEIFIPLINAMLMMCLTGQPWSIRKLVWR